MNEVDLHIEEHALASEHFPCEDCSCAFLTVDLLEKHFEEDHNGSKLVFSENEDEHFVFKEEVEENTKPDIQMYVNKIPKCVTIKKKK